MSSDSQWSLRHVLGQRLALLNCLGLTLLLSACNFYTVPPSLATVESSPNSGVTINISVRSNSIRIAPFNRITPFTLTTNDIDAPDFVTLILTAPPQDPQGNNFGNWSGCDTTDPQARTCTSSTTARHALSANYGNGFTLGITKTHTGNFTAGQQNASYSVTVANTTNGPTSGTVTVMETAPSGLTVVSMTGAGWACDVPTAKCTRSDVLNGGNSYPPITVTVNLAANAPPSLVNKVSVSWGNSGLASALDTTNISDFTVSAAPASSSDVAQGASIAVTVTATPQNGFSGSVIFDTTMVTGLPTGASATSFTPSSIMLPATTQTTLLVQTSTSTPLGPFTITISATSGNLTRSTSVTLNVTGTGAQKTVLAPGSRPAMDDAGDTIVAQEALTTFPNSDAVVFAKNSAGLWGLAARLHNVDGEVASVAISGDGNTVVVGSCTLSNCLGHGFVYLKPSGGWSASPDVFPNATLTTSDGAAGDRIGATVSIDQIGATVAVGAPKELSTGSPQSGSVYVFAKPSTGWALAANETAKLTIVTGTHTFNNLGISVSMDSAGDTIAAGATNLNAGSGNPGTVFVFQRSLIGPWVNATAPNGTLTASDGANGNALGYAVSISGDGNTIVAGAPTNPFGGAQQGPGASYVFFTNAGQWFLNPPEAAKLTASDGLNGDFFGAAVSISRDGSAIITGAPNKPVVSNVRGPGAAYVFVRSGQGWTGPQNQSSELAPYSGADLGGIDVTPASTDGSFGGGVAISADAGTKAASGFDTNSRSVIYLSPWF